MAQSNRLCHFKCHEKRSHRRKLLKVRTSGWYKDEIDPLNAVAELLYHFLQPANVVVP